VTVVFAALLGWVVVETRSGTYLGLAECLASSIPTCWPFVVAITLRRPHPARFAPIVRMPPRPRLTGRLAAGDRAGTTGIARCAAAIQRPWHDDPMTLSVDFSATPDSDHAVEVERLCDTMEAAAQAGRYPRLRVERPWSVHNPVLEGEFASPRAIRWYLERELGRLASAGARISVSPGRAALDLSDPRLAPAVDETRWDLRRKKLFLFAPERMALSIDRLQHYTGTTAESFQRYVLLTNYSWHVEEFRAALPGCTGPDSDGRQMPAWHHMLPGRAGVTMVNIGVGPSNAKTMTDHLAVLRPDLVLMIGHCAGLRNHQEVGDLVLATSYLRDDRVLDDMLPLSVPVVSNHTLNTLLLGEVTARRLRSRMGTVYTTANRNWEFYLAPVEDRLRLSRAPWP
jgi:AMP nucleosidase